MSFFAFLKNALPGARKRAAKKAARMEHMSRLSRVVEGIPDEIVAESAGFLASSGTVPEHIACAFGAGLPALIDSMKTDGTDGISMEAGYYGKTIRFSVVLKNDEVSSDHGKGRGAETAPAGVLKKEFLDAANRVMTEYSWVPKDPELFPKDEKGTLRATLTCCLMMYPAVAGNPPTRPLSFDWKNPEDGRTWRVSVEYGY